MIIRNINLKAVVKKEYVIALISDLHDKPYKEIINDMVKRKPDYIAVNGDFLYAAAKGHSIFERIPFSGQNLRYSKNALSFLKEAVDIAPTIVSTGNHELYLDDKDIELLKEIGAIFLDNSYYKTQEIVFGGLSSTYKVFAGMGYSQSKADHKKRWKTVFDSVKTEWLGEYCNTKGYKILLCHHPEFYEPFLKEQTSIDLILAGHAHGGQIRLFGHGLYAYGQGWFPKYTSGLYDNRLIVSPGLANTSKIPRFANPKEIIYIEICPYR